MTDIRVERLVDVTVRVPSSAVSSRLVSTDGIDTTIDLRERRSGTDVAVDVYRRLHELGGGPFPQFQGLLESDVRAALSDARTATVSLVTESGRPVARLPVLTPIELIAWYSQEFRSSRFPHEVASGVPMWHLSTFPGLSDDAFEEAAGATIEVASGTHDDGCIVFTDHAEREDDPSGHRLDALLRSAGAQEIGLADAGPVREHYFVGHLRLHQPARRQRPATSSTTISGPASSTSSTDELWRIYEAPFLRLAEKTPLRTYFTRAELAEAAGMPGVLQAEHRADDRLVSWMMMTSDIESFPWMDPAAFRTRVPGLPRDRFHVFPGLVTDEGYRGNHCSEQLIDEMTFALAQRGADHVIIFETLDENAGFLPELIEAAVESSGHGSLAFEPAGAQRYRAWRVGGARRSSSAHVPASVRSDAAGPLAVGSAPPTTARRSGSVDCVPEFPRSAFASELSESALVDALPPGELASDFQWLSLKAWNPTAEVSRLDGALVVGFNDYHDETLRFYGFTGGDDPEAIAWRLLEAAAADPRYLAELQLLPESVATQLGSDFAVTEERDHFDYLYRPADAASLPGSDFRVARNDLSRFRRRFGGQVEVRMLGVDEVDWQQLIDITAVWAVTARDPISAQHELEAFTTCAGVLRAGTRSEIVVATMSIDGLVVGYDVTELTRDGWALDHFRHTPHGVVGAQTHLRAALGEHLQERQIEVWNAEQDLGVPGLRAKKLRDRPSDFVVKYRAVQRARLEAGSRPDVRLRPNVADSEPSMART